ncbi:hypothetical protein BDW02DRAFT_633451 [Decorospora gaudefroyi]|uniref:DUF7918 domain-containing protein n=1 Tax=Decorospora gaudefroyi TaxID=184978 RepID=A0A6A5KBG9_9PLEO|nr:hypothetical protein BDW02DRAFT_633451 [Decorospora gaudefroyi]
MAVTEAHPRVRVSVQVHGVPLEEYNDDEESASPNSVTKYIEAQSGAEFSIKAEVTRPFPSHTILMNIYLDGKNTIGRYLEAYTFVGTSHVSCVEGVKQHTGNKSLLQKFCFLELNIDDSHVPAGSDNLMKDLKDVGEITVKAHYVKNLRLARVQGGKVDQKDTGNFGKIPEKALKGRALSHHSGFRPPVNCEASQRMDCDYVDASKKPFATFKFRYHSRAALQSLLVIPRSPSPVPLEDRDVHTLTPEESRELIRRLREREGAAAIVKPEGLKRERSNTVTGNGDGDNNEVAFVSEKRRRLPVIVDEEGVETVDLT